jgi:xanthine dehydrogenase YagR molybdenum-binding subunit
MNLTVGKPIDRVDGRLKVTGAATYSAEYYPGNFVHGVMVLSTISKGRVKNINTGIAEKAPGVVKIMTYENAPQLHFPQGSDPGGGKFAEKDLLPLQSDRIFYSGQVIAVVMAATFEQAEQAAKLVKVEYDKAESVFDIHKEKDKAYKPAQGLGGAEVQMKRGDAEGAMQSASTKFEQTYTTPVYHHNAMEPHATVAEWKGDEVTIYDATQSVAGSKSLMASMLGVPPEKVRVVSLYIGGGFGSKGFSWPNTVLTAMAAKLANRPVKLELGRQQMFTTAGRRSETIQKVSLGADQAGKLSALKHDTISETSFVDEFVEPAGVASSMLYSTPNAEISHSLVRLNKGTPCPMRAPGEAPGTYAIEAAMDELAIQLNMDPVQLRLINHTDADEQKKKEFSEKNLKECYQRGADAIGWSNRKAKPGSTMENGYLVGYGMATATYPANRSASSAKAVIHADGRAEIFCATQDIGTGTYTVMTQIAADTLSLPVNQVSVKLGDSAFPKGANSGGSQVSASVGPAIRAAAMGAIKKLTEMAVANQASPLHGIKAEDIVADNGRLYKKNKPDTGETYAQILNREGKTSIEALAKTNVSTRQSQEANPAAKGTPEGNAEEESKTNNAVQQDEQTDRKPYAFHSFGAQFVKVLVDPLLGTVKVDKAVAVMDIGTVLNLKTAENQIMGGMIFGIGMALMEHTAYDPNDGRVVTKDLAQYLVPVNADMPDFDIQFINKPDLVISPIGARGIGEIGITGITAAIANAVYNATGKRIRELPITPDKLIS